MAYSEAIDCRSVEKRTSVERKGGAQIKMVHSAACQVTVTAITFYVLIGKLKEAIVPNALLAAI